MNDEQVEKLLHELSETRLAFDRANEVFSKAITSIKWNRFNTIVQYGLIVLVFIFGTIATMSYVSYRDASCERGNDLRITVAAGMEQNAFAIGSALAVVFNAPQERLEQYLKAYNDQRPTREILVLREC